VAKVKKVTKKSLELGGPAIMDSWKRMGVTSEEREEVKGTANFLFGNRRSTYPTNPNRKKRRKVHILVDWPRKKKGMKTSLFPSSSKGGKQKTRAVNLKEGERRRKWAKNQKEKIPKPFGAQGYTSRKECRYYHWGERRIPTTKREGLIWKRGATYRLTWP